MTERQRWKHVKLFARLYGVQVLLQKRPQITQFQYAGDNCLRGRNHGGFNDSHLILHELAHWLVATKEQKAIPEFGLGAGQYTTCRGLADSYKTVKEDVKIEVHASFLCIVLAAHLGLDFNEVAINENWDISVTESVDQAEESRKYLAKRKRLVGLHEAVALVISMFEEWVREEKCREEKVYAQQPASVQQERREG